MYVDMRTGACSFRSDHAEPAGAVSALLADPTRVRPARGTVLPAEHAPAGTHHHRRSEVPA
ncbi:hypothetical protein NB037_03915 [Rathayibacter sp. ZW T2_19]|uniref:Uncharacterized protein n=1 Tax=Rathayibacter rubneri TaxID=2950106 RepID=A0A9X2DVI8_9MICO|nr:hypothetical protein [Rathayibacter rubneri]MCM6761557.1 hypothetical protein [Rathayibacter rubneri]